MRNRRSQSLLIAAILAAIVGALLVAIPGSPLERTPTLGLDLQGGIEVVLKAVPAKGQGPVTSSELTTSRDIMQNRINKLGVSEPDVRTQPPNEIVIQLAGVHDPQKAAALIGKTAQLQFFDLEGDVTGPSRSAAGQVVALTSLYDLLTRVKDQAQGENAGPYYLFRGTKQAAVKDSKGKVLKPAQTTYKLVNLTENPAPSKAELLRPFHGQLPEGDVVLAAPPGTEVVSCPGANGCIGASGVGTAPEYFYLLKFRPESKDGPPEMTGKDLNLSGTQADIDPNSGQPIVVMQFTGHGSNVFHKITRKEAQRGQTNAELAGQAGVSDPNVVAQYAGHFAIVLDGVLRSAPYIDYKQNPDGISGSSAQITLGQGGTTKEAKDLALVLQTGALPVNFIQIERTDVSATLGKDSLHQAWVAALVGLAIVALFLLVLYRFLGLVAIFGLAIYALLYYTALLLFNVTLTLPGFAGLILTIGVAADANVVIFERIKEEVRAGKSVRAAVQAGYGKGFHTIIDANVVTAITALVLFAVATAEVKGFALTLLIGTVISLITAVAATRAMLGLLAGFSWFNNARFMGAAGTQRGHFLQIDFMKRRYLWFAISGLVVLVSALALGVKGLNLGIDFKGGTQYTFATTQPVHLSDVRNQVKDIGQASAIVQGQGKARNGDEYRSFQIRLKSLSSKDQSRLSQDLKLNAHATKLGVKNVSSSFGRQIAKSAILAIIVSLLLIVIYVAVRFGRRYAAPVIVAMLHDVVIAVGVYALLGREVSTSTVAAILTVLGYSIYDTIIIFDRIRENVPLMRKTPFAVIANVSLWETIRRSLATTLITLLPVACLLVFGGATLKDFAFALLVGITAGAYSSIFIASPLLTVLMERDPDYKKRKGQAVELSGRFAHFADQPHGGQPALATADAGDAALAASEAALAAEPTPELEDVVDATPSSPEAVDKRARREARKARRRSRPHGRQ